MSKKINPRRIPATKADVQKAKRKAEEDSVRLVVYMMLYVLLDKHGATPEELRKFGDELNYVADSIKRKYIKVDDIVQVIEEEYGYTWGE